MKTARTIIRILMTIAVVLFPLNGISEGPFLKIGVSLPLSGDFAAMGSAFVKGSELYNRDHPSFKGRVKFVFEDHEYDGKSAIAALHKLRNADGVDLLIVWGNTPSGTCAPIAERLKFPMVGITYNPHAKGRKYAISFGTKVKFAVKKIADHLQAWELNNPAAVTVDVGNALLAVEMLKKELNNKLKVTSIATNETDFKSTLVSLRSNKVDGLLLFATPAQAITFSRQAAQLKYFPKVIGGDIFADHEFLQDITAQLPEVAYVYGDVEPSFIERLEKSSGGSGTSYFFDTATGYTLAMLLDRISQQTTTRSIDLLTALQKVDTSNTPIRGLTLSQDEEYGRHFDSAVRVYKAQSPS